MAKSTTICAKILTPKPRPRTRPVGICWAKCARNARCVSRCIPHWNYAAWSCRGTARCHRRTFYVTVRSKGTRSSLDNVDYRIWNAKFSSIAFSNGVTCMHPMDAWIQFAQYLNLTELVVLAEALIRRYGYAIEQFTQRLTAFHRVIGRARCEAALKLVKPSDSVQETRTRLALMLFGLPIPQTQWLC